MNSFENGLHAVFQWLSPRSAGEGHQCWRWIGHTCPDCGEETLPAVFQEATPGATMPPG